MADDGTYAEVHTMLAPLRASGCPGCRMPILFDSSELLAAAEAATDDVMCAFCGTVTARWRLAASAYACEPAVSPVPPPRE